MPENIIEAIRGSMNLPPLTKIDPNDQEPKHAEGLSIPERLAQAALPAVMAGFFRYTRTDNGCNTILAGGHGQTWLQEIFENKKEEAVQKVADYAGTTTDEAESLMEDIAQEAVLIIHQTMDNKHTAEKLREYIGGQRHNILVYLPAAMQMGYLLEDNSIDDRTNKMEGPVSSLMHKIGDSLTKGDETKYP
ncbi:MAG TPA: hypothetical protein PKC69_07575 [Chitinophagaceae bacterium]|nr:hypothetical protein [Chitinophagaceae bacterium]